MTIPIKPSVHLQSSYKNKIISPTLISIFIVIYSIIFCQSISALENRNRSLLGKPSPDFSLNDISGKPQTSSQWKGHVVLINFWATWCQPCKKEIPMLNKVQQQFKDDGLKMIGIAIDNATAVKQFNQIVPMNYVNLLAGPNATTLIKRFGNFAGVLPYTVIINKKGNVVQIASGLLTETYLKDAIEKYL